MGSAGGVKSRGGQPGGVRSQGGQPGGSGLGGSSPGGSGPRGVSQGGSGPGGGVMSRGGPTSVVSKLQLSSSAVSWPYITLCPRELWVMLQSIMGVKKKKNYGMVTPPCGQTDGWTDMCQNITFPSYYVRGR